MSRGGVRPPIWAALGASAAFLAAALVWGGAGEGARPPDPAPPAPARVSRLRVAAPPPGPLARATTRQARADGAALRAPEDPLPDAEESAAPIPDTRSAELVGLEREAESLAVAAGLVGREVLDAAVAELERAPGESEADFADRRDAARERFASDEVLLQHRLSELYEGTVYAEGFPVEAVVVPQERQQVGALPPEDRAALLRRALDHWEPARPEPRFEAPESGLVWRGGTPAL